MCVASGLWFCWGPEPKSSGIFWAESPASPVQLRANGLTVAIHLGEECKHPSVPLELQWWLWGKSSAPELVNFLRAGNRAWEITGGQKWVRWTSLQKSPWLVWRMNAHWSAVSSAMRTMPNCQLRQWREGLVSSHPFTIPTDRQKLNMSLTLEERNLFCSVLQAWSRQIAPIFHLNPSQHNITRHFNYLNKLPIQLFHPFSPTRRFFYISL